MVSSLYNQRFSSRAPLPGWSGLVWPLRLIKPWPVLCLSQNLPRKNTVTPALAVLMGRLLVKVRRCQASPSVTSPGLRLISLGVDTFKNDPISQFKLDSPDYVRMGERIARLGKPTLFVMEGGYAVEEIGVNAVNVLEGFLSAQ